MAAAEIYARNPSLRGDRLVFVADDDLWWVHREGGEAMRLTADSSPAFDPRISPDATLVAYLSYREGPADVHVVGLGTGEEARRLTYWADDGGRVLGWLADGRIAAATTSTEPFRDQSWAWALPPEGGMRERLPYGPITGLGIDAAGAVVLGRHQSRHRGAAWKRYRGGTAGRIWIDRLGDGNFVPFMPELNGQLEDPGWCAGRVVFVSDHEGFGNIYSATPDGTDLRRHTDHDGFYARAAATDGQRVVYQCAGDLWLLDDLAADSRASKVDIELASVPVGRRGQPISAPGKIGAVGTDHTGKASAVEVEGNLVWLTHRDGPAPVLSTGSAVRARLPGVLGTTSRVAWITDADGDDAIEVAAVAGPAASTSTATTAAPVPRRFGAGRLGRVLELSAAPDGHHVAIANHEGAVLVASVEDETWREVDRSHAGPASGLTWSPDSAWLAWSHAGGGPTGVGDTQLRQIRLARLGGAGPAPSTSGASAGGSKADEPDEPSEPAAPDQPDAPAEVIEATPLRFDDHDPAFTADGRYLGFLSARTFDPVYDEHVFDLGFLTVTRPYLLVLGAQTPSPFAPQRDGRAPGPAKDDPAADSDAAPSPVLINRDGLQDRVVSVPVEAGHYTHLQAVEGGLVWQVRPLAGQLGEDRAPGAEPPRSRLERYDLAQRKQFTLVEAVDAAHVTGDGRYIVVVDKTALRVVPSARPAGPDGDDAVDVDLSRIRLRVDPPLRWLQMFDETVRLMRDHFWVEDMAGVDWTGVAARYRPLVSRLATRADLSELLWELNGELGASHAYEMPPPRPVDDGRKQGWLGADLVAGAEGWTIASIVAPETSVPGARSPLLAPGVNVVAGDRLTAVDAQPVGAAFGPAPLLVGAAERPVELLIRPVDGTPDRAVVVTALESERPLRYHAWVAGRRAATHEASGGRVGYVHIPDMQAPGWAELHRDLRFEIAREALIVDLRNNGGGHLSQLVLEKLSRQITGWDVARHKPSTSYPSDAPRGPLVAIANEYAGSDGDIATIGFKRRRLGPVVGTRTWGGVIGIDGEYKLVDGTTVTQPRYSFWFDQAGWGVENYGVDPDVEVVVTPQDWAAGRDPQLEAALRLVIEALERNPALTPPDPSTRPSRTPPSLPARPGWPEASQDA